MIDKQGVNIQEREELRSALIAAQESAAVQVLLECCLPKPEEQVLTVPATFSLLYKRYASYMMGSEDAYLSCCLHS